MLILLHYYSIKFSPCLWRCSCSWLGCDEALHAAYTDTRADGRPAHKHLRTVPCILPIERDERPTTKAKLQQKPPTQHNTISPSQAQQLLRSVTVHIISIGFPVLPKQRQAPDLRWPTPLSRPIPSPPKMHRPQKRVPSRLPNRKPPTPVIPTFTTAENVDDPSTEPSLTTSLPTPQASEKRPPAVLN